MLYVPILDTRFRGNEGSSCALRTVKNGESSEVCHCDYRTKKSGNLKRHMKRHSVSTEMFKDVEEEKGEEKLGSDKEEWEKLDPGNLNELLGEYESVSTDSSCDETSRSSDYEGKDHRKIEIGQKVQEDEKVVIVENKKIDPTVRIKTNPPPVFAPNKKLAGVKSAKEMSLRDKI